jgi:Acetyltransferase (GNAT) family
VNGMTNRATEAIGHVRGLGARVAGHAISAQAWSVKRELELLCEVATRPGAPAARVPVSMEECDPRAFEGFEEELRLATGTEYGQALRRVLVCRAGIRGLHVARDGGGEPIYAQWLLSGEQRDRLRARLPGPWRPLAGDEMTVEFAYTFTRHRGMGVMAAGMGGLVEIAADRGAARVYTYVRPDNVPSLRGCAKVGFLPAREVATSFRLGFHTVRSTPVGPEARAAWDEATAPRK